MRASERQRTSGELRPAWPGNAVTRHVTITFVLTARSAGSTHQVGRCREGRATAPRRPTCTAVQRAVDARARGRRRRRRRCRSTSHPGQHDDVLTGHRHASRVGVHGAAPQPEAGRRVGAAGQSQSERHRDRGPGGRGEHLEQGLRRAGTLGHRPHPRGCGHEVGLRAVASVSATTL